MQLKLGAQERVIEREMELCLLEEKCEPLC
jgi:hypothetical protein